MGYFFVVLFYIINHIINFFCISVIVPYLRFYSFFQVRVQTCLDVLSVLFQFLVPYNSFLIFYQFPSFLIQHYICLPSLFSNLLEFLLCLVLYFFILKALFIYCPCSCQNMCVWIYISFIMYGKIYNYIFTCKIIFYKTLS